MTSQKKRSDCPISYALEAFGDKWSLLIVRDLIQKTECTYGDFAKSPEKIATNILAARLLSLEENGIIQKLEHPESKAKVLYRLTPKGIDLVPLLVEINLWAQKHTSIPDSRKEMFALINENKQGFIEATTLELQKEYAEKKD